MTLRPKSIAEHIDCLARLTGAPAVFVMQVRELFSRKGISLDQDATPYLKALDEAFLREESIRTRAAAARQKQEAAETTFERIEKTYRQQLRRLPDVEAADRVAQTDPEGRGRHEIGGAETGQHRETLAR